MTPANSGPSSTLQLLLSDPVRILDEVVPARGAAAVLPPLLWTTLIGGAAFGAAMGGFHGGLQVLFAAVKLPFVLLLPAMVALPGLRALAALLDHPSSGSAQWQGRWSRAHAWRCSRRRKHRSSA